MFHQTGCKISGKIPRVYGHITDEKVQSLKAYWYTLPSLFRNDSAYHLFLYTITKIIFRYFSFEPLCIFYIRFDSIEKYVNVREKLRFVFLTVYTLCQHECKPCYQRAKRAFPLTEARDTGDPILSIFCHDWGERERSVHVWPWGYSLLRVHLTGPCWVSPKPITSSK